MTDEYILLLLQDEKDRREIITTEFNKGDLTLRDYKLADLMSASKINILYRVLTGPKDNEQFKEWIEANRKALFKKLYPDDTHEGGDTTPSKRRK